MEYREKVENLLELLANETKEDVMVAFSGGVDSSLLLKLLVIQANKNNTKVYAVTLNTMLHPKNDLEVAKRVAEEVGAVHIILQVDELQKAGILDNPVERCYYCKRYLFEEVIKKAKSLGISSILEGTNATDLTVYRPGIRAIKELGIKSPLVTAQFTKEDVRRLAKEYGVSVAKRPSTPCLATRFPYGTSLSYEAMEKVEQGEAYLRNMGFYNVRLRVHNEILRIEVDQSEMEKLLVNKQEVTDYMKKLGYQFITLDLEGFRSGSMDYEVKEQL